MILLLVYTCNVTKNRLQKRNLKKINLANQQACLKNKLRGQILWANKMSKNDKLLEKEDNLYVRGRF